MNRYTDAQFNVGYDVCYILKIKQDGGHPRSLREWQAMNRAGCAGFCSRCKGRGEGFVFSSEHGLEFSVRLGSQGVPFQVVLGGLPD